MTDPQPPLTLLFGGDFAPRSRYEALIAECDGDVFGAARAELAAADLALFNLEAPLCAAGKAISKSGPAIRAAPATLRALSANGIGAVCLANNHIFDYGPEGLSQTLAALQAAGIRHAGAGLERSSAEAPLRLVRKGRRISIFAFAEQEFNLAEDGGAGAALLDPLRMAPLLLAERAKADVLIVCVHGGNEYFPWPRPGLRRICHFLIEMGADAVIGHHPHVPGPYEIHNGKPIFYSLGNLIFDTAKPPPDWDLGYLVRLDVRFDATGRIDIAPALIPYRQSVAQGGLVLLEGDEKTGFLARIETMRDQLENRPQEWLAAWQGFVLGKARQTAIDLSSPLRFPGLRRLLGLAPLRNLISPPSRRLHRLNLLRCESHRELVIAAMASPPETALPRTK